MGSDGRMLMLPKFADGSGEGAGWGTSLDPASSQSTSSPVKFLERLSSAPDFSGPFLTWQDSTET